MAFKMRSGNKVSFKNMGSSSPAHQITISEPDENATVEGVTKQAIEGPSEEEQAIIDKEKGKRITAEETQGIIVNPDTTTNKEAGDKKTERHFDFTDALKGFLEAGGGKEGLLKGLGAGISKKSPNEKLAIQKARDIRNAKKDKNKKAIETASDLDADVKEDKPGTVVSRAIKTAKTWTEKQIQAAKNKEIAKKENIKKQKAIDTYNAEEKTRTDLETKEFRANQAAETLERKKAIAEKIAQKKAIEQEKRNKVEIPIDNTPQYIMADESENTPESKVRVQPPPYYPTNKPKLKKLKKGY